MAQKIDKNNYIDKILVDIPELKPLYEEHLSNLGEILPTFLFGSFTLYTVDIFLHSSPDGLDRGILERIFTYIENVLTEGDHYSKDIVITGFLENLIKNNHKYEELKLYLEQFPLTIKTLTEVDDSWNKFLKQRP